MTQDTLRMAALASLLIVGVLTSAMLLAPVTAPVSATVATGDSMGNAHDTVVVHADTGEYAVGDEIVFTSEGHSLHHRIVDETDDGYITQGDTEPVTDQEAVPGIPPVQEHEVHGEALVSVPTGAVLGGLVAILLAVIGSLVYANLGRIRVVAPDVKRVGVIVLVALLAFSVVAPFLGFVALEDADHDGTVAAEPDSGKLWTGSEDGNNVRRHNASDGSAEWNTGLTYAPTRVQIHPNGSVLYAYEKGDAVLRAFDADTGTELCSRNTYRSVGGLAMHPNGSLVYFSSLDDGTIMAFDADNCNLVWKKQTVQGNKALNDVAAGVNGNYIYTGSQNLMFQKLDADTGDWIYNVSLNGRPQSIVTHPDGNEVIYGDDNGDLVSRSTSDGTEVWRTSESNNPDPVAIDPQGEYVYAHITPNSGNHFVQARDVSDQSVVWNVSTARSTYGMEASPNGDYIYHAMHSAELEALNRADGSQAWFQDFGDSQGAMRDVTAGGSNGPYGNPVEGYVTNSSDGSALSGETVELKQSGSVVSSTTTNSSGGYKFEGLEDGDYTVEVAKDGYHTGSKSFTLSGSPVRKDLALDPVLVTGYVNDSSGSMMGGAEVYLQQSGSVLRNVTTNASGGYTFTRVPDGSYNLTAEQDSYENGTGEISVSRSTLVVNLTMGQHLVDESTYNQIFELQDNTDGKFNDATLEVQRYTGQLQPGTRYTTVDSSTFNHNNRAFFDLENGADYRLEMTDDGAKWTYQGFTAAEDRDAFVIQVGGPDEPDGDATATPTPDSPSECVSFMSTDDGLVLVYDCDEPADEIDYTIGDGDGNTVIDDTVDFDEPTDYYEDQIDEDVFDNATNDTSFDDWEVDYNGTTSAGEVFNGSLGANEVGWSLDSYEENDSSSSGGFGAPPGGSGGGTPTWVIGIPAVAAVGYVVLRQRGVV